MPRNSTLPHANYHVALYELQSKLLKGGYTGDTVFQGSVAVSGRVCQRVWDSTTIPAVPDSLGVKGSRV